MIVDSSALMAILEDEPRADEILALLAAAASAAGPGGKARMSAASLVEVGIVADARSTAHGVRLDRIVAELDIEIVPVTRRQADIARLAYRRFGRGTGAAARLNFGDCFAYALAVAEGEPLLFLGDDFGLTDIAAALPGRA